MAQIQSFLISMMKDVPESTFETVLKRLKITEKDVFKSFARKNVGSKSICGDFVLSLFSYDKAVVATLYASIEGVLFLGGCAPGIGIAFNLIDACFCFILGNWLGCFVAIISCFPIPGFKIAGKGIEKFIMFILRKISPTELFSLTKQLGKNLSKIGFHTDKSYMYIRKQLEEIIPELHNPFAEKVIRELSKVLQKFPTLQKDVSKAVCKTGEELTEHYGLQPKLLSITPKASHL